MVLATSIRIGKNFCPGFRIRRFLGRGSFGSVWEAEREEDRRFFALKFIPCHDNGNPSQEIRILQIVRQLCHPHLIQIEQVWCHRGYIGITMELADGSLQDLLDAYQGEFGTPLAAQDVCQYLTQTAAALDFLNARQHAVGNQCVALQHCDVKPSNLLLCGETIKITDFGLASMMNTPHATHRRAGTFAYAAPEIFRGRLSDRSDQYALAVTYCQLRGGRMPFPDPPQANLDQYSRPAPDLSMLPKNEQAVVARALSPVPQDRWPSCQEMMRQLSGPHSASKN